MKQKFLALKKKWILSLEWAWQKKPVPILLLLLAPFTLILRAIVFFRCLRVKRQSLLLGVPVIVVGNMTVGGTGKTPLVIYLVNFFKQQGLKPGVITRGFGRQNSSPLFATQNSHPAEVGDEALLIACKIGVPVRVDSDRKRAATTLITEAHCNVIISDDGLQHAALPRTLEIAVVDGKRQFGNGWVLPVGPLREPISRLKTVDWVVYSFSEKSLYDDFKKISKTPTFRSLVVPKQFNHLKTKEILPLSFFHGKKVHAVAGIGHPQRFFSTLRALNIEVIEHPFLDHHLFVRTDLIFNDDLPIIMTEKDATKCSHLGFDNAFSLAIEIELENDFAEIVLTKVRGKI